MLTRLIAAIALAATVATPSLAQISQFAEVTSPRHGASAGAYVRIPLDRRANRPVRPQLGLRVAAIQDFRDPVTGRGSVTDRDVVDLRLSGLTHPTLFVGETPITGAEARRLNGISTGEAVAIGGGVVLLVLVVAVVAAGSSGFGSTCPVIDGDTSHCID